MKKIFILILITGLLISKSDTHKNNVEKITEEQAFQQYLQNIENELYNE